MMDCLLFIIFASLLFPLLYIVTVLFLLTLYGSIQFIAYYFLTDYLNYLLPNPYSASAPLSILSCPAM